MKSQESQSAHYARHYRQLELDDNADWQLARSNYRRLVHLWHPDRFAQRPQEREHAQQEFIKVTKSHTVLRNFYLKNKRMPFQLANTARKQHNALQDNQAKTDEQQPDGAEAISSSVFTREPTQRNRTKIQSGNVKKGIWIASGAFILLSTIMFFLIQDRKANQAIAEQGRELVKEAPRSEFMPSASEIRRSQTRGAFVKPTK